MGLFDFLSGRASKDIIRREYDALEKSVREQEELPPISAALTNAVWEFVNASADDPQLDNLRSTAAHSLATYRERVAEWRRNNR